MVADEDRLCLAEPGGIVALARTPDVVATEEVMDRGQCDSAAAQGRVRWPGDLAMPGAESLRLVWTLGRAPGSSVLFLFSVLCE